MQAPEQSDWYPLKFASIAKEKVWGGHRLAEAFQTGLPNDSPIGEVWLVWDQLLVANGPLQGRRLADLVREHPAAILGNRFSGLAPVFPLLAKLIDVQDMLSVQVHPNDAYAQTHEGEPFGKAEAWYIVEADPGARLIHGIRTSLTRAAAEEAVHSGAFRDLLDYVEVFAGDVIMNPPGTIHAIGPGLLLYEIQQSSDLTYRFYDWDRNDPNRPLHIDKSLDVADLEPLAIHTTSKVKMKEPGGTRTLLVACERFAAEHWQVRSSLTASPGGECFHILTALEGSGAVRYGPSLTEEVPLTAGESVLIPAGIERYQVRAHGTPLVVIKAWVPDLLHDIVNPLREQGIDKDTIVKLGGEPRSSDLLRLVAEPLQPA